MGVTGMMAARSGGLVMGPAMPGRVGQVNAGCRLAMAGATLAAVLDAATPFVLLDDARAGGAPARLYRRPVDVLVARQVGEVQPLLDQLRAAAARGRSAAGFLSYEAAPAFEPTLPAAAGDMPLAWFGLFDGWEEVHPPALLPDPAGARVLPPDAMIDRATYDRRFAEVQALIAAGDLYQANLTFAAAVRFLGDPLALYAAVRSRAAAGWGGIVATGEQTILSFSPELFVVLDDGAITCRPMKGTARPGPGAAERLDADPKQRAENLMIVDLIRNDLSRVAQAGSVAVPELFAVEHYPTVLQMTSTVTADLAPGRDAIDLLAAAFPCGSITGAPKLRAIEALAAIETVPRGIYTGSIGRIDANGSAQFNVAIRTLTVRGQTATMGLGGGIVADSKMDDEWDEALAKGAFLTVGQRTVDLLETMAFDPLSGIALLSGISPGWRRAPRRWALPSIGTRRATNSRRRPSACVCPPASACCSPHRGRWRSRSGRCRRPVPSRCRSRSCRCRSWRPTGGCGTRAATVASTTSRGWRQVRLRWRSSGRTAG